MLIHDNLRHLVVINNSLKPNFHVHLMYLHLLRVTCSQYFICKVYLFFEVSHVCGVTCLLQSIPVLEFTFRKDRISLAFVDAALCSPVVSKGSISREMKVFPAECRGRKCSYKGKLVVSLQIVLT